MARAKPIPHGMSAGQYNKISKLVAAQAKRGHSPKELVELARRHNVEAMMRILDLMNGKSGQTTMINTADGIVKVDVPVPPAVQLRAAELILERGYGRTPQAILVKDANDPQGVASLPIMERIAALRAAAEQNTQTTDLEANEVDEVGETDEPEELEVVVESRPEEDI